MNEAFRTIIVSDAHVALARQITETLAPVGGAGMYTTGLSPDSTAPATHWISSGFIDADYAMLLPLLEWTQDEGGAWIKVVVSAGSPLAIMQLCAQAELTVTVEEVADVLAASDVTVEQPFGAMSRLGLQMVQTTEDF